MWIDNNSWHARLYQWWFERKFPQKRKKDSPWYEPLASVNLCPYVRTILFWAPLRWVFVWGPKGLNSVMEAVIWGGSLWLPNILPVKTEEHLQTLFGYTALWFVLLVVRLFVLAASRDVGVPVPAMPPKAASFLSLIGTYTSKAHTQICPQIELRNGGQK